MTAISSTTVTAPATSQELEALLPIYRAMLLSSQVDELEQQYTSSGEGFFHVAGRGHEAVAALQSHLGEQDWLNCHYRSKALMIARGLTPLEMFSGFFAKDESASRGRQMSAHLSCRRHNITSIVGPVGNNALHAVGMAAEVKDQAESPVVICCLGEGTTQEGEVLEAIHEAARAQLPVLFVVEDNGWAISTTTSGKTFYSLGADGQGVDEYCGLPVRYLNGLDTLDCHRQFGEVVGAMREQRTAVITVVKAQRLTSHTNADDQRVYRSAAEIAAEQAKCPVAFLKQLLIEQGVSEAKLDAISQETLSEAKQAAETALNGKDPEPTRVAAKALPEKLTDASCEYLGGDDNRDVTMIEALRGVLDHKLASDDRVTLFGQDIEDPKGDVFGLTRGLSTKYPERVKNSPLSESTIVGAAAGRAMAGGRPVALLQFSDFLPLAFNQICSELSTMFWRTDGQWQTPVVVMAPCGGYRPGLGHFHAQSFESIAAHLPGVDVMVPSTAADAAGLLNAAFESERPTLFFYPKALLNDRAGATSSDLAEHLANVGRARTLRHGSDLTVVAWGNTIERAVAMADILEDEGKNCEILDLRSIAPWDQAAVIKSCEKTGRLLVIHEDNHTCGMGAEIVATVVEQACVPVQCKRLARADTPIPCNFANQLAVMPSVRSAVETAASMLDLEIEWQEKDDFGSNVIPLEAIGASPSDEMVTINEWHVKPGDTVEQGDTLVDYEADKAATELVSSCSGVVKEILIAEGESVAVGTVLLTVESEQGVESTRKPVTREELPIPLFTKKLTHKVSVASEAESDVITRSALTSTKVLIQGIASQLGGNRVDNTQVLTNFPDREAEDIVRGTGIESRPRVAEGDTVVTLAARACEQLLQRHDLELDDIDLVVCSTGTPQLITPSTACQVMAAVDASAECQAYDINAACSGYVYALQAAYDAVQANPKAKVLVITSEVLSPLLDTEDYTTAILFGDAATATLISAPEAGVSSSLDSAAAGFEIVRPELAAQGEAGNILTVPHGDSDERIGMDGTKVFTLGVKKMSQSLKRVLDHQAVALEDLDLIVPHQANQRIISAITKKLGLAEEKVFSNIKNLGNTSSNTIPLALIDAVESRPEAKLLGLAAFGGGFTYGACLLKKQ